MYKITVGRAGPFNYYADIDMGLTGISVYAMTKKRVVKKAKRFIDSQYKDGSGALAEETFWYAPKEGEK
jgi:hypothetical protein